MSDDLHVKRCDICNERYDARKLDQVRFHSNNPHRPIEATGIVGIQISQRIDGKEWFTTEYVEQLRALADLYHHQADAWRAQALSLSQWIKSDAEIIEEFVERVKERKREGRTLHAAMSEELESAKAVTP